MASRPFPEVSHNGNVMLWNSDVQFLCHYPFPCILQGPVIDTNFVSLKCAKQQRECLT